MTFFTSDTGARAHWIKGNAILTDNIRLTLIIGGASSGKSNYGEEFVKQWAGPRVYMATAQAFDDEMRNKIADHRADRATDGWETIEEPLELVPLLARVPGDATVLLDCATMWLSNVMLAERDTDGEMDALIDALRIAAPRIVVVSNEVGLGVVPDNALARAFRVAQGRFNARLAAEADLVVNVIAGLPHVLKGRLP